MTRHLRITLLLAVAASPLVAQAETNDTCTTFIQSVPASISTQGVYCLKQHLATSQSTGAAIAVTTNNVTIDCNGYKLGGLAAGPGTQATGIIASNRQNLTVRNCNIRGFRIGIVATGSGHLIEDNTINNNTATGIDVSGDGNLIRNNAVSDTGGGTGTTTAHGIFGSGNADIRNNFVDGVIGSSGSNTTVYGIRLTGGTGATVGQNIVRNLVPEGTGLASGIYTSNGTKIFVDDNRVSLPAAVPGSIGYRCNASNGALRNSTSWGFETHNISCLDDGGNASH
jgi:parallel beta-helix repeat protein